MPVINNANLSIYELNKLVKQIKEEELPNTVVKLEINRSENGKIELDYDVQQPKFERIRRITGYLVGTLDRWNDAKKLEEHDRFKHNYWKEIEQ